MQYYLGKNTQVKLYNNHILSNLHITLVRRSNVSHIQYCITALDVKKRMALNLCKIEVVLYVASLRNTKTGGRMTSC